MTLTAAQVADLAEHLLGTGSSLDAALEDLGLEAEVSDAEAALEEVNVEACTSCGWWCASSELGPDPDTDDGVGLCEDCKQEEKEGTP